MLNQVKLGRIFCVENKKRKLLECEKYYAIQVEALDGNNEECLLFTEKEWNTLPIVDTKLKLVDGRLYPFTDGGFTGYLVKTTEKRKESWFIVVRKLSERKYLAAQRRSRRNPEDLTRKSWITDLLD